MKKNGFTLVELLVVIAIIGILSVLVIPNIVGVKERVDTRIQVQKGNMILTAAEMYVADGRASSCDSESCDITINDLLEAGYIDADVENGVNGCSNSNGCVVAKDENNIETVVSNDSVVHVYKKNVGYVAKFNTDGTTSNNGLFVEKVCEGFGFKYDGISLNNGVSCGCSNDKKKIINKDNGSDLDISDACILISNNDAGTIDNWVRYDSDEPNWRVVGLYYVDNELSVKMITSDAIE